MAPERIIKQRIRKYLKLNSNDRVYTTEKIRRCIKTLVLSEHGQRLRPVDVAYLPHILLAANNGNRNKGGR